MLTCQSFKLFGFEQFKAEARVKHQENLFDQNHKNIPNIKKIFLIKIIKTFQTFLATINNRLQLTIVNYWL
jgi:hypothetical protein